MKTKKFGRGGDILTALGAGLAGYGAYKYFTKDKDDDYSRKVRDFNAKNKPAEDSKPEEKSEPVSVYKKEPSVEEKRAMDVSQGRPEMGDVTSEMKSDEGVKRVGVKKRESTAPSTTTTTKSAPPKTEPVYKQGVLGGKKEPKFKGTGKISAPDLSVPKGFNTKSSNKTTYGTDTTSVFQKKAAQERSKAEEKAKKKAENREFIERQLAPLKKGGVVKKYASGGSVSPASKRADGIALRGKTRGKVY